MTKAIFVFVAVTGLQAASVGADAQRGAEFFQTQKCVICHVANGVGEPKAPDLGRRYDRDYTPAGIAARMWNHAPVMWAAMGKQNIAPPSVTEDQARDLFAFFYSVRYFEKPGEAQRGKRVFESKHCAECHSITGGGPGTPVDKWESLTDPIVLAERMWNHADRMKGALAARKIEWPEISAQELNDLLVYLQNLPQTRGAKLQFVLPGPGGEALFEQKGCANCHKGKNALERRLADNTLTDVAASMWNHAGLMQQSHPDLTVSEMRQILGYVWAKQFFDSKGHNVPGKKTFESKKCGTCHDDRASGAPILPAAGATYSAIGMVSVLWRHGPAMLQNMQAKKISWPQFSPTEMDNLIAYLNSR
jgi:mono/diheme cytochrome c family protein